jgi:hypothetical protein
MSAVVHHLPGEDPPSGMCPGDFILCHRKGFASALIRAGERLRDPANACRWSHAAMVVSEDGRLVEALTRGVSATEVGSYRGTEYDYVRTSMATPDCVQAQRFANSCVGERYGWPTILGIALRFLTPGRGLWFGMNGTEICSGLVAQGLCRGDAIFPYNPASMTPSELAEFYLQPPGRSNAARQRAHYREHGPHPGEDPYDETYGHGR